MFDRELKVIVSRLDFIEDQLDSILQLLQSPQPSPKSSVLYLITSKGATIMPLTVHLSDNPGIAKYQEFDGPNESGNKVSPTGTVTYTSDNPSVATVDPSTGHLGYVSSGSANISASDGGNLPASDVLTVIPNPPDSSSMTLSPGA